MFSIRQSSSVQDYIDRFAGLIDQLVAYGRTTDPVFFAMRFMDGLKDDIRSAVHMQRPQTFDTASVFALLQEELQDPKRKDSRRADSYSYGKSIPKGALPLPLPPRSNKAELALAEDRRSRGLDDKLKTLRDYRRAWGLCIRCGEKWSRDHKCSETVQLHVLQEFWDICHSDEPDDSVVAEGFSTQSQVFLAVSVAALNGQSSISAIQFQGMVQGHPARILIDSGSSHTFVSHSLAAKLSGQSPLPHVLQVKIANGHLLQCDSEILQLSWSVQGCHFQSDAKVLPLAHFDVIVGMDWLARFSRCKLTGSKSGC
jgi:hypothetical protein